MALLGSACTPIQREPELEAVLPKMITQSDKEMQDFSPVKKDPRVVEEKNEDVAQIESSLALSESIILPSPTMGSEVTAASTSNVIANENFLFMQTPFWGYGKFDYNASQLFDFGENQNFPLDILQYSDNENPNLPANNLGAARFVSYANFANKIAFWVENAGGELWITDLDLKEPVQVFANKDEGYVDEQNSQDAINLIWLPNDRHVIFWLGDSTQDRVIIDVHNSGIEPWPWECKQVALSPRTSRLAIWCSSSDEHQGLAVVEWSGEIWYSDILPQSNLINLDRETLELFSGWSASGDYFAYFDRIDNSYSLIIADSSGEKLFTFPNTSWQARNVVDESRISLPQKLLHWSQDGSRLLFFGYEQTDGACPQYVDSFSPSENPAFDVPCWQVFDLQTKQIIWTWLNFTQSLGNENSQYWEVWDGTIAPNGNVLAFHVKPFGRGRLGIADIKTNEVQLWESIGGAYMRWQSLFP